MVARFYIGGKWGQITLAAFVPSDVCHLRFDEDRAHAVSIMSHRVPRSLTVRILYELASSCQFAA